MSRCFPWPVLCQHPGWLASESGLILRSLWGAPQRNAPPPPGIGKRSVLRATFKHLCLADWSCSCSNWWYLSLLSFPAASLHSAHHTKLLIQVLVSYSYREDMIRNGQQLVLVSLPDTPWNHCSSPPLQLSHIQTTHDCHTYFITSFIASIVINQRAITHFLT